MLRVGIIGAGLIGKKRAACLKGAQLVAVTDKVHERAYELAKTYGARVESSWESLVAAPDIDAVIVATTHEAIPPCSLAALQKGKHVLAEKPAGRNPNELELQVKRAKETSHILRVGFNHRFHPAIQKAKTLIDEGAVGPLMYMRARYGHGGRVGYEKEWRARPEISGGGELLDQGVHLIDLCRFFGGDFDLEWGKVGTYFWNMEVEDNGFLSLKSTTGSCSAWLHASCTEWKNLFDFEIFGKTGKIQIWGLGKSYGIEELRFYKMKPEMGPPDLEVLSFPGEDLSWQLEWDAFLDEIKNPSAKTHLAKIEDAFKAVKIVHEVYSLSHK